MSSDNYRDGCSKRFGRVVIVAFNLMAWMLGKLGK